MNRSLARQQLIVAWLLEDMIDRSHYIICNALRAVGSMAKDTRLGLAVIFKITALALLLCISIPAQASLSDSLSDSLGDNRCSDNDSAEQSCQMIFMESGAAAFIRTIDSKFASEHWYNINLQNPGRLKVRVENSEAPLDNMFTAKFRVLLYRGQDFRYVRDLTAGIFGTSFAAYSNYMLPDNYFVRIVPLTSAMYPRIQSTYRIIANYDKLISSSLNCNGRGHTTSRPCPIEVKIDGHDTRYFSETSGQLRSWNSSLNVFSLKITEESHWQLKVSLLEPFNDPKSAIKLLNPAKKTEIDLKVDSVTNQATYRLTLIPGVYLLIFRLEPSTQPNQLDYRFSGRGEAEDFK